MVSQLGLVRGSLFLMDVFLNVHVMGLYVHDSLFILILVALDYVLKLIHILTVRLTAFLEAGVFHLSFMDNAPRDSLLTRQPHSGFTVSSLGEQQPDVE